MYNEKIVAFYIRVSTTKQAKDGYSLEAQEEQAIKKAKEVFGEDVKWKSYIDSGKSAKDTTKRFESQDHPFNGWLDFAPIRGRVLAAPKGAVSPANFTGYP